MKYQKLENLESGWKWKYLIKKHQEKEQITKYIEKSAAQQYIDELYRLENQPEKVIVWIDNHIHPQLNERLKQTIRAKRKRYFNVEQQNMRKKSIDLEFLAWQRLSTLAKKRKLTLSAMVSLLIDDAEHKDKYTNSIVSLKKELQKMLSEPKTELITNRK